MAEWFAHLQGAPGLTVHVEPDIVWKTTPGPAWFNCGVRLRFEASSAAARLDTILEAYRANGRGAGFWVAPAATPADLEKALSAGGLRCRKYFPAMYCVDPAPPPSDAPTIVQVEDHRRFLTEVHPSIGRLTTQFRKQTLAIRDWCSQRRPQRTFEFIAWVKGAPVGACTVFLGSREALLSDVSVLESHRGRGIGGALVRHAARFACEREAPGSVLLASAMGRGVYVRAGFREVGRFGFWYRGA